MSRSEVHSPEQTGKSHRQRPPGVPDTAASSRERDVQYAKRVLEQTPDVREDRIAAAKQALQSGRLCVRGTELAERLLADDLHREDFSGA